MLILQGF